MIRSLLRYLLRFLIRLIARVDVVGYENVPAGGSCVIATNHLGFLDIAMLFYALDNWDVVLVVADKWAQNLFFRWVGKHFNFVFIDRYNRDVGALRKIINLMDAGNNLVISPEGTRSRTESLLEGKPGVSYLAARAGHPIMPVAIAGTEDRVILSNLRRLRRSRITLRAGPAFTLPPLRREDRDLVLRLHTDEIMCRIAVMLPEKYRGFYADHPRLKELLQNSPPSPPA